MHSAQDNVRGEGAAGTHDMSTLTKRLAGPSTAKAGMETVDQAKVNDIIYKASEVDLRPRAHCQTLLRRVREASSLKTSGKRTSS